MLGISTAVALTGMLMVVYGEKNDIVRTGGALLTTAGMAIMVQTVADLLKTKEGA